MVQALGTGSGAGRDLTVKNSIPPVSWGGGSEQSEPKACSSPYL